MEKQTAVEWLFKELLNSEPNILEWNKLLEQAKEIEKQQIIDALRFPITLLDMSSEEYYNQTFGAQK